MTAKAKPKRDPLERYYTPDDVASAVVGWMKIPSAWTVIEPSIGGGAWARALRASGHVGRIIGVDLDPGVTRETLAGLDVELHTGDWVEVSQALRADLVLGNPPFKPAGAHILAGLRAAPRLAFLLRGTFTEWTDSRAPMWKTLQPVLEWTIGDRLSFLPGPGSEVELKGSDSVCHSILFFRAGNTRRGWHREVVSLEHNVGPSRSLKMGGV